MERSQMKSFLEYLTDDEMWEYSQEEKQSVIDEENAWIDTLSDEECENHTVGSLYDAVCKYHREKS